MDIARIAARVAGKLPVKDEVFEENEKVIGDSVFKIKQKLDQLASRESRGKDRDAVKKLNEVVSLLNTVVNVMFKGHSEVSRPAEKVMDRLHKLHQSIKPIKTQIEDA